MAFTWKQRTTGWFLSNRKSHLSSIPIEKELSCLEWKTVWNERTCHIWDRKGGGGDRSWRQVRSGSSLRWMRLGWGGSRERFPGLQSLDILILQQDHVLKRPNFHERLGCHQGKFPTTLTSHPHWQIQAQEGPLEHPGTRGSAEQTGRRGPSLSEPG